MVKSEEMGEPDRPKSFVVFRCEIRFAEDERAGHPGCFVREGEVDADPHPCPCPIDLREQPSTPADDARVDGAAGTDDPSAGFSRKWIARGLVRKMLKRRKLGDDVDLIAAREVAGTAVERGLRVIIAGAGGAAHLPGMVAAYTTLPVIGVPVLSSNSIDGWDSVLSILQMPAGVPVATVALDGAKNAGILAAQIIATSDKDLAKKLASYKTQLREKVENSIREIKIAGYENNFDV